MNLSRTFFSTRGQQTSIRFHDRLFANRRGRILSDPKKAANVCKKSDIIHQQTRCLRRLTAGGAIVIEARRQLVAASGNSRRQLNGTRYTFRDRALRDKITPAPGKTFNYLRLLGDITAMGSVDKDSRSLTIRPGETLLHLAFRDKYAAAPPRTRYVSNSNDW